MSARAKLHPSPKKPGLGPLLRQDQGFSVIETLIVFLVVGIAILPLASIQFNAKNSVDESGRYADAVILAQASLESMRSQGFGNADTDTTRVERFTIARSALPYIHPNTGIPVAEVEEFTVTVSWIGGGDPRSISVTCLKSSR